MKLLLCPNCGDIFNLSLHRVKSCHCGKTWGNYINRSDAEHSGGYAFGIGSKSLPTALRAQRLLDQRDEAPEKGLPIVCFTIPASAPTMRRIKADRG